MELYRKKINITSKSGKPQERYEDLRFNNSKRPRNIYIQKVLKQNKSQTHIDCYEISSSGENIPNIRSNMEDIFSDENNKNKAIKYVIQVGKNKNMKTPDEGPKRFDKSASPGNRRKYQREVQDSNEATPLRKVLNLNKEPYYSTSRNRFNTINNEPTSGMNNLKKKTNNKSNGKKYKTQYNEEDENYYDNKENYMNPEDSQNVENDLEISSINDEEKMQGVKYIKILDNRNNKPMKKITKRDMRNKDIQAMPKLRKDSSNKYLTGNAHKTNNINTNTNTDEEMDINELIRTIEDLQSIINGQKHEIKNIKKDNYNKDKEINMLRNELDSMQKELDDKKVEHDKEIEDIFRDSEGNPKLKNEYYKLLQDYDININDYNTLKDDYNKMVDEYNKLKKKKKKSC